MDNSGATEPVGEQWKYDQEYHHMSDFLGVDKYERDDFELVKKISFLRDWAGKNPQEALGKINDLRKSLGYNTQGKTLVNQLFHNVRLKMDTQRAQPTRTQAPQPQKQTKQTPIQKSIAQAVQTTVQSTIGGMVQKALGDKKLIQSTVDNALKGAIK